MEAQETPRHVLDERFAKWAKPKIVNAMRGWHSLSAGLVAIGLMKLLEGQYLELFFLGPKAVAALFGIVWLAGFLWAQHGVELVKRLSGKP